MARNKYPEETVNRILDESFRLFLEKGYEHTTIQDIINNLGGLSKGAIYHHFRSKEEILNAVTDRALNGMCTNMSAVRDRKDLNGKEKLVEMFRVSVRSPEQEQIFSTVPDLMKNPQLLALQFQKMMEETIPRYVEPVIIEGAEDGSIPTEHPRQLAELLMLLCNIWLNPLLFRMTEEELLGKLQLFNQLFQGIGLNLLEDLEGDMEARLKVLLKDSKQSREKQK